MSPKSFLVWWNNNFPYDRWYRKKYHIAFGSEEHRRLCQIEVKMEYLEDVLFGKYFEKAEKRKKNLEEYKNTGQWLNDREENMSENEKIELFNDINFDSFDTKIDLTKKPTEAS